MAISAPAYSGEYAGYIASPTVAVNAYSWGAKLRNSFCKLTFTAAGFTTAALGDITLIRMPAGKVRIYSDLCRIICPAGTATSDLDVGYGAYTKRDGSAGTLLGNAFADSLDVGGAAIDAAFTKPTTVKFLEIDSQSGFDIVCSFDTANSPASGDMYVWVVYSQGN
jgi:hypothetical protein